MPSRRLPTQCALAFALFLSTAAAGAPPAAFVSLSQFLTSVGSARYADFVGSRQFAVDSEAEFEGMRAHLLAQYEGVTAAHSFLIGSQYVDCIPVMEQPSVRQNGITALAPPPPLSSRLSPAPPSPPLLSPTSPAANPPPPGEPAQPLLELGLDDSFGNAIHCDDGTIPMRRVTLDDLARFPTLRAFLAKKAPPPAKPLVCPADYRYAVGQVGAQVPFYGALTTLAVWYPSIHQAYGPFQHSLSQMWVEGSSETSALQTAEAGWTVDPSRTGTTAATLFVYWTSTNYQSDGCYDLDCKGFVQTSDSWVLGAPNWPGPSISGNPSEQVFVGPLQWTMSGGNWWLSVGFCSPSTSSSCTIGYYPGSIYRGGQMSRHATVLRFGGEVFSPKSPAFSPMGSGALANAGANHAAYQFDSWYRTSSGSEVPANLDLVNCNTNSSCFTFECANSSCSSFYFGGPGGTSCP
jgi:hypothetical protein